MASKDHIIYQMISCNAFMARSSTTFSPPPPPLPTNPSDKKKDVKVDELFQGGAGSKRSKSRIRKNLADSPLTPDSRKATASKLKATADLKKTAARKADADRKAAAELTTLLKKADDVKVEAGRTSDAILKANDDRIAAAGKKAIADLKAVADLKTLLKASVDVKAESDLIDDAISKAEDDRIATYNRATEYALAKERNFSAYLKYKEAVDIMDAFTDEEAAESNAAYMAAVKAADDIWESVDDDERCLWQKLQDEFGSIFHQNDDQPNHELPANLSSDAGSGDQASHASVHYFVDDDRAADLKADDHSSSDDFSDDSQKKHTSTHHLSAKRSKEIRNAAMEKRRSLKIFQDECRQKTLSKARETKENLSKAGIWAANKKSRAADIVLAFEMKMAEVFRTAAVKIAAYERTTDLSDDTLMAAARAAGRIMYASGTIIHPGVKETDIRSPVLSDSSVLAMPISENCLLKTHVVTPIVSPTGKSPLFTMEMFTPYVDKGLEAWKKDFNVCDAEYADPDTWCTDTRGKAMKIPYVYKLVDDYKQSVADSKFSLDDVSPDARSERAARRSAVIQKVKEEEIAEFETSLKKNKFNRSRRLSPSVIS
jgi:hypothetical protein